MFFVPGTRMFGNRIFFFREGSRRSLPRAYGDWANLEIKFFCVKVFAGTLALGIQAFELVIPFARIFAGARAASHDFLVRVSATLGTHMFGTRISS